MDGLVDVDSLASKIKLLLMDVDGVLTDGGIYIVPGPGGAMAETKGFNSQDGMALQWLRWKGIQTGVISGRESAATTERARQVGMAHVYLGNTEKVPLLEEILGNAGIDGGEVAYVGDGFTDVPIMRRVGFAVATANARPEVKAVAHYVTAAPGGAGAVRETIEVILKAQGLWAEILTHYEMGG